MNRKFFLGCLLMGSVFCLLSGCGKLLSSDKANWVVDELTSELNLTSNQSDQLSILKTELLMLDSNLTKEKEGILEFQYLLKENGFEQSKALMMIDERLTNYRELASRVITPMADFYNSLNPEQKMKFRAIIQEHEKYADARGIFKRRRFHARGQ